MLRIFFRTRLAGKHRNVVFRKPRKGDASALYNFYSFKYGAVVINNILFPHAFSGSAKTSTLYNIGKTKFTWTLKKLEHLRKAVELQKHNY